MRQSIAGLLMGTGGLFVGGWGISQAVLHALERSHFGDSGMHSALRATATGRVVPPVPPGIDPRVSIARVRPSPDPDDLSYESRAYGKLWPVLERDGFELRTVYCWRDGPLHVCSLCSHHPTLHYLGATLVTCDARDCYWPVEDQEYARRAGWTPDECILRDEL